jgi:16S rRNA (cytidine1402-2'-O)-methyltransferase
MTQTQATTTGSLYIVATPIGNRDDITYRAVEILKSVDLILAEDTRHSLPLLTALGIKNQLSSLHAHNESSKSNQIIEQLLSGRSIALISDAGTPLISDPGYPLVKQAQEHQIPVIPIPGPCALITALSAAGIPCDQFLFLGFLPAKQQARMAKLSSLKAEPYTLIFYESTHRINECIEDIETCYGSQSSLVLAKELTKTFERFVSGSLEEVKAWLLSDAAHCKGEFVLLIPPRQEAINKQADDHTLNILLAELPLKQAVSLAAKLTQGNKNELYQRALELKKGE